MLDSYPRHFNQIVTNLIQNAVVHGYEPEQAGYLHISAAVDKDDVVTMIVRDGGKGMDAATLAHIFDPFFTTRLGQGGSGLGLSVSRNIAMGMLGGTLYAASEPGHGASFTLAIPRVAPV